MNYPEWLEYRFDALLQASDALIDEKDDEICFLLYSREKVQQMELRTNIIDYRFKIQGRDVGVSFYLHPDFPLPRDFDRDCAQTLHNELHNKDILPCEMMPFGREYPGVLKKFMGILSDTVGVAEDMDRMLMDTYDIRSEMNDCKGAWREYSKDKKWGEEVLQRYKMLIWQAHYGRMIFERLQQYRPRWQRQLLIWMLQANLRNDHTDGGYLRAIERYLKDTDGWLDIQWWDEPEHCMSYGEWVDAGYESRTRPTMRRVNTNLYRVRNFLNAAHSAPLANNEVIHPHWQMHPTKNGAELRRVFWVNETMKQLPNLAHVFAQMYPVRSDKAKYDDLIYDWAGIVAGEYGHVYHDWWGESISLDHARHVFKMNFAQEVYRFWQWDFRDYTYYEVE